MSPRQLIEKLESLGVLDPKVLSRIRREIENPEKNVKTKAILGYLVKKGQITEAQAIQLLKSDSPPTELAEVSEPASTETQRTDDLTGVSPDPPPAADLTAMDEGQAVGEADVMEVQPIEVPSTGRAFAPIEPEILTEAEVYQEVDDGFGEAYADANQEHHTPLGFVGKKDLKDQWDTKWLYIGFAILGFLLLMAPLLYIATTGQKAEDQFKAAMESFESNAYQDAIAKFDQYIEDNPKHKNVPTAKARRVQSVIASADASKNWFEALTAAGTLLPDLAAEEDSKIEIIRDDLAGMLPRALRNITDKARKVSTLAELEKEIVRIRELKKVVDNPEFVTASRRKKPITADHLNRIDNNVRAIEGQINKEKEYNRVIVEIRELGSAGETDNAFAKYKKLIRNYGDLAGREALRNTMLEISQKEQELVKPLEATLNVANDVRSSPIQSSVVLATIVGKPADDLKGEISAFLVEGSVYGIDAGTGVIAWRRFVGYQTTIQPQTLDQDLLLVADQKHHDLMLLEKSTGNVQWRTEIGELFLTPSVDDNRIVVTTASGKAIQLNRQSGKSEFSTQLPQNKANVNCMLADRQPVIYQPGYYSNIYMLSTEDLSCRGVFYLGHYQGSIAIPPQSWQGYVLVAVNGGDYCDLFVLKPAENGFGLELTQVITRVTNGPVSTPMQKFGRSMMLTADNGQIRILELVPTDEKSPVRTFAEDEFTNSSGQAAFVLSEGSNLWIASNGISRFRIKRNLQKFERDDIVDYADTFLTPLQKLDEYILHVRRRTGSGMLSASLVEAKSMQAVWRNDFGGQLAGSPLAAGDELIAVSNQGDLYQVGADEFTSGYTDQSVRASKIVEDLQFESLLPLPNGTFACIGPSDQEEFLFAPSAAQSKLLRWRISSAPGDDAEESLLAAPPIVVGENLIVPTASGQVERIDPSNGRLVGTPFLPPTSAASPADWLEPTLVKDELIAIASSDGKNDDGKSVLYLLNAKNPKSLREVASLEFDEPLVSRLVSDQKFVYGVTEGVNNDQLVCVAVGDNLTVKNQVDLPGRVVAGPWLLETGLMVKLDNDQIALLTNDLTEVWSIPVPNDQFAGAPENVGTQILLTFRSGKLLVLEPSSGKTVSEYELQQPIIHQPTRVGQSMYFSGMDGTIHMVDLDQMSGSN